MFDTDRTVIEGLQTQGSKEKKAYRIQTTPWGMTAASPPVTPVARIVDIQSGEDKSSTMLSTVTCTVENDTQVKTGLVQNLVAGRSYYLAVSFSWEGDTPEFVIFIDCDL